jgi:hypothetical protein
MTNRFWAMVVAALPALACGEQGRESTDTVQQGFGGAPFEGCKIFNPFTGTLPHTVFQQGRAIAGVPYTGTQDTQIKKSQPSSNFSTSTDCRVDGNADEQSCLIRWDLSSLPSTSTVLAACLWVQVTDPSVRTIEPPRLTRAWSETQATWLSASSGVAWEKAGAKGATDRDGATITYIKSTEPGTSLYAISASVVQGWITTPASNFGISIANSAAFDGLSIASSEAANTNDRPALLVAVAIE